jgi:hypothetical protein
MKKGKSRNWQHKTKKTKHKHKNTALSKQAQIMQAIGSKDRTSFA